MLLFTRVLSLSAEIGPADASVSAGPSVVPLLQSHQLHIITCKYNNMDHVITRLHITDLSLEEIPYLVTDLNLILA